jgi:hypothetical protein
MSFKKIRDFLSSLGADENADEMVDSACGKMTEEEVLKIAVAAGEKDERWVDLVPRHVTLCRDGRTKRLIWSVEFLLNWIEEDYITGTIGAIDIDDETGEVVAKHYVPR